MQSIADSWSRTSYNSVEPSSVWGQVNTSVFFSSSISPSFNNTELNRSSEACTVNVLHKKTKNVPTWNDGIEYIQVALNASNTVFLSQIQNGWKDFEESLGNLTDFINNNPSHFQVVGYGRVVKAISSARSSFPISPRRLHFKILSLLALSHTYSYELDKLRNELGWDELKHGNFHNFLCSLKREGGKELYALTVCNGRCRIHLIKDIYLNAVSQRLRAFHEKHYKSTPNILLSADRLRRFLGWDCTTKIFKEWLVNHSLGKLLSPPTLEPVEANEPCLSRDCRPQIISTYNSLVASMSFVRQQYNLVSVICYSNERTEPVRLSLVRITQANKQVLLIDMLALVEEAKKQWQWSFGEFTADHEFFIKEAPFVKEFSAFLTSEEIRKCVWDFNSFAHLWREDFGIEMKGIIDMYPIVAYFFPEWLPKTKDEEEDVFPCPRLVAENLCPQIWKSASIPFCKRVDWDQRPLTEDMITRAGAIGVGVLLDIRKGTRTEMSTRVNEKMMKVSELYTTSGKLYNTSSSPDLVMILNSVCSSPSLSPSESITYSNDSPEASPLLFDSFGSGDLFTSCLSAFSNTNNNFALINFDEWNRN